HGIGGGSWCWYKVRCQLENSGYKVTCIDLKGAGIDQSDAKNIHTFDEYNKPLIDFMSSLPDDEKGVPNLSEFGDPYDYGYGYGPDKPPTSALLKKEFHRDLIYQLSPPEALVSARFNEGPDVDEVPRVYIKMTQDLVLKLEQQEAMVDRWPPAEVYVLESDHSPYFSAPSQLVDLLVKAASSVAV
ncbi:hypothetical protein C3L33_02989, partial [Rhododendron williamsianum]